MFEINFRIIMDFEDLSNWSAEKFDEESDIEGFFELNVQGNSYGHYHAGPLGKDEVGFDLLTGWFQRLLKVIIMWDSSDYVAISDIESYNTWIEFVKYEDKLKVSVVEFEKKSGFSDVVTKIFNQVKYSAWKDIIISVDEFKDEVIQKSELYIERVININKQFISSSRIQSLNDMLIQVRAS